MKHARVDVSVQRVCRHFIDEPVSSTCFDCCEQSPILVDLQLVVSCILLELRIFENFEQSQLGQKRLEEV